MAFHEYAGRRVVVTGASSGIGRAVAKALDDVGAEVVAVDVKASDLSFASFHEVDLAEPAAIAATVDAIGGHVDSLFNCAGLPPMAPPVEILKVNFLGTRLFTEGVTGLMSEGGSIVSTSSDGGFRWRRHLGLLTEFVSLGDFKRGIAWYEQNQEEVGHPYAFSKEALNVWTMRQSAELIKRGIRINTVSPGSVQTPMLESIEAAFPREMLDATVHVIGRRSTPEEQVGPLLFLNSDLASYVNGADLAVDGGHWASLSAAGSLSG